MSPGELNDTIKVTLGDFFEYVKRKDYIRNYWESVNS